MVPEEVGLPVLADRLAAVLEGPPLKQIELEQSNNLLKTVVYFADELEISEQQKSRCPWY